MAEETANILKLLEGYRAEMSKVAKDKGKIGESDLTVLASLVTKAIALLPNTPNFSKLSHEIDAFTLSLEKLFVPHLQGKSKLQMSKILAFPLTLRACYLKAHVTEKIKQDKLASCASCLQQLHDLAEALQWNSMKKGNILYYMALVEASNILKRTRSLRRSCFVRQKSNRQIRQID